jgi:hypothetical protein
LTLDPASERTTTRNPLLFVSDITIKIPLVGGERPLRGERPLGGERTKNFISKFKRVKQRSSTVSIV